MASEKMTLYEARIMRELKEKIIVYESVRTKHKQPFRNNYNGKAKDNKKEKTSNESSAFNVEMADT